MKSWAAALVLVVGLAVALAPPARAANPQIAGLQVALRAHGLYAGAIDGVAGPQTRKAVIAFQRKARLAVDGRAGIRTRTALGPLGRPLLGRRMIARGAFGWDVSVLQFLLTRKGVYAGALDGYMGPETMKALRAYQRQVGLLVDGVAGPATLVSFGRVVPLAVPQRPAARSAPARVVVRRGDTLTELAERHRTTVGALARANGLGSSHFILEGAMLRLPVAASPTNVRGMLDRWARHYGVDPALARALAWMESGFQTNLTSSAGAWGVMQIIPAAWEFVETVLIGRKVPRTAEGNVRVGVALLRHLLRRFDGNERLALAGWYQGEHAVRTRGVYAESEQFVANVLALRRRGV
jgi:peptidoglycan hydrolase-like protein with peptidoglycan-binding domain